jgi:hypothetical protein
MQCHRVAVDGGWVEAAMMTQEVLIRSGTERD